MKKTISIILTALIFLTLTGCGNNSAVSEKKSEESETTTVTTSATSSETENSTITTTETAETTTDTTTETTEETTETENSDNNSRPQKHGYNDNDLYYFDVGNYTVSIPNYWEIDTIDTIDDEEDETEALFAISDNGDKAGLIILPFLGAPESMTFDTLYDEKDELIDTFKSMYDDFGNCDFTGLDIYETAVTKGIIFKYLVTNNVSDDTTSSPEVTNTDIYVFAFPCENGIITIHLCCSDNTTYLYDDDFYKILENIKIKDKTTETTSTASNSSNGIRPEFKEAMESYEEFFDEYCEFMKKYQKSPDDLTLLSDYLEFMSKYDETMTEMENIDTDDLSDEELKLYLETQTSISSKLLSVYNTD